MTAEALRAELASRPPDGATFATDVVETLLKTAAQIRASDIHLLPTSEGLEIRWRVDGVLLPVALLPASTSPKVVARLKVLAELLTYQNDAPQEGRIRTAPGEVEMRLSTIPTLHGEKAVVRLFSGAGRYLRPDDLGLPGDLTRALHRLLGATSGAVIFSGPSGSGKTTTIYACLRELAAVSGGRRSLATLEDPVEIALPGVSQTQVNPRTGFTLEAGLRAMLRQDPEVIAVGEVRDRPTAEVLFQASLTGHLVLTTFHAAGAASVIGRLTDMGIEPYLLRSGLLAVIGQRLVRRLCECAVPGESDLERLGLGVAAYKTPAGCPACGQTGYRGRMVLAEILLPEPNEVGRAILAKQDVNVLHARAVEAGMTPLAERARRAVEAGETSPAEVRRVLGLSAERFSGTGVDNL